MGCSAMKAQARSCFSTKYGSLLWSRMLGLTAIPGRCFLFFEVVLIV